MKKAFRICFSCLLKYWFSNTPKRQMIKFVLSLKFQLRQHREKAGKLAEEVLI